MPWGKLDDSLYDHPKLDDLPPSLRMACVGLWSVAISWSNRRLTDGHIPASRVRALGGTTQQAEALVKARLFDAAPGGYVVHDFLDFNDSREFVLARRAADAERQRIRRESQGVSQPESRRDTDRTPAGVQSGVRPSRARVPGPSSPVPALPGPTTDTAREDDSSDEEADVFAFLAKHGAFIRPDSGFGIRLLGLIDRRGTEAVMEKARALDTGESMSDRQWVFGLEKALDEIPSPPMDELPVVDAVAEKSQRIQDRAHERRLEYFKLSGRWDPNFGPEPEWQEEWGIRPPAPKVAA